MQGPGPELARPAPLRPRHPPPRHRHAGAAGARGQLHECALRLQPHHGREAAGQPVLPHAARDHLAQAAAGAGEGRVDRQVAAARRHGGVPDAGRGAAELPPDRPRVDRSPPPQRLPEQEGAVQGVLGLALRADGPVGQRERLAHRRARHSAPDNERSAMEHHAESRRGGEEEAEDRRRRFQVLPGVARARVRDRRAALQGHPGRRLPHVLGRPELAHGARPLHGPRASRAHRQRGRLLYRARPRAEGHAEEPPGALPRRAGDDEVRHPHGRAL
mmetsp:Transcript_23628/g.66300  ORF Transcript_23628/g.66300 Transcript_23628/m.66300 type:complete len:274 (-) Transcript_23628:793-1614(-)